MENTNLINQRQVFVGEYVRSGDHMEAAKKKLDTKKRIHCVIRPLSFVESVQMNKR